MASAPDSDFEPVSKYDTASAADIGFDYNPPA
jgi:hypothetical protein